MEKPYENQMEKKMEHELGLRVVQGLYTINRIHRQSKGRTMSGSRPWVEIGHTITSQTRI